MTAPDVSRPMRRSLLIVSALFVCALQTFAQSDIPTFKAEAKSALVWDADFPESGHSSIVWDPLTGHEIHKLSSAGIEVSSRVGYERVSPSEAGELLNYTTTIANNTDSDITVQYGGASADGRVALPVWLARTSKDAKKGDRKNIWELGRMRCFKNGFASSENFFSANAPSRIFMVHAQTAVTISSVSKDPRPYSIQCSLDGCHVTGTVRYYITVNKKDYVFVWSGRSVIYCGE